ncbi:hypothetical protein ABZ611_32965 [Streptomyces sp. NPDC007861]|uniref:hypothetical protein n=1 Tax=Streptomyces sp. NPDC007861 TaxID=3154893 RepID=UPI0033EE97B2
MRARARRRPFVTLLLVCAVAVAAAGCGGADDGQAGDSLELEEKWHDRISDAVAAKPEGCRAGVGSACETHAAAVHAVTEQLREGVAARADKERFQAASDGATAIDKDYDEYFGKLCATVPETTLDAATSHLFATCSGLYTTIITGAADLQQNLRPSDGASAG